MSCRLFVDPQAHALRAGSLVVDGDAYHYLFRVRRLRPGSEVTLFDGAGCEAEATVASVSAAQAVLTVEPPQQVAPLQTCHLIMMPALIKGERMDLCIQKLVELGVAEIAPVCTARTVVRLSGERARRRHERFVDIARDAARQSHRATVPEIRDIVDLDQALRRVTAVPLKLLLWPREQERSLRQVVATPLPQAICALIGPEGGFTPDEVDRAVGAGFEPVGLGPQVLRAETAAMAVAAVLAFAPPAHRGVSL
jgi:16S rRNA (uracil1498-N3)-methyltransferase